MSHGSLTVHLKRAGLTQTELARLRGVSVETVNRHCNGKTSMTLDDAEEYGEILGCTAPEILFGQGAMKIFGTLDEGTMKIAPEKRNSPRTVPWRSAPPPHWRAVVSLFEGGKRGYDVIVIDQRPIEHKLVPAECETKKSVVCDTKGNIRMGTLSRQDHGLYDLLSPLEHLTLTHLELAWASPVLMRAHNVELMLGEPLRSLNKDTNTLTLIKGNKISKHDNGRMRNTRLDAEKLRKKLERYSEENFSKEIPDDGIQLGHMTKDDAEHLCELIEAFNKREIENDVVLDGRLATAHGDWKAAWRIIQTNSARSALRKLKQQYLSSH